jgi:hypothetical protein
MTVNDVAVVDPNATELVPVKPVPVMVIAPAALPTRFPPVGLTPVTAGAPV